MKSIQGLSCTSTGFPEPSKSLNDLPFAHKSFATVNTKPCIDLPANRHVISGLRSFDLLFVPVKLWCISNFFPNRSFKLQKAMDFCGNTLNSLVSQERKVSKRKKKMLTDKGQKSSVSITQMLFSKRDSQRRPMFSPSPNLFILSVLGTVY